MTLSLDVLLSIEMRDAYCLAPRISFTIHHLFDCNNKENKSTYFLSFVAVATWKKYGSARAGGGRFQIPDSDGATWKENARSTSYLCST